MKRSGTARRRSYRYRLVRRGLIYSLGLVFLILGLGGFGFWLIDPSVASLSDGLWLAFTTAATVGYGDLVPTTHLSRAFSVLVVLLGLAVLSLVTASLAAIFVEDEVEVDSSEHQDELLAELRALRAEIQSLRVGMAPGLSSAHVSHSTEEPSQPVQASR